MSRNKMVKPKSEDKITVYYDGACPTCVRDRRNYEKLSGKYANNVTWFDITDNEEELIRLGIDPKLAMTELHIKTNDAQIISELDAYIILMKKTFWLKPVALLLSLPVLKPLLAKLYHYVVNRRLKRSGRL